MADQEHLAILKQGVETWNQWRKEHINIQPDLYGADLSHADLSRVDLSEADLSHANLSCATLSGANLSEADLSHADLSGAFLNEADLSHAGLSRATLSGAYLSGADLHDAALSGANFYNAILSYADLSGANLHNADLHNADLIETNLSGADLTEAVLIEANLTNATLTYCSIYGISAWNVQLEGAQQESLIITQYGELTITVDNLEVAQFIYLLLNHQKIRQTIDTITSHVVLLLGRFPPERKDVIDALSAELHRQNYSPVVFNVAGAENKDVTATVRTLANMARFVLLDLTGLDDAIREIADNIVPRCVVPIRPLLLHGSSRQEYEHFRELGHKYRWVLAPYRYNGLSDLESSFQENILQPVHEKIIELQQKPPFTVFIGYAPEDTNTLKTLKTHLRPLERAGLIELWDDQDVAPGEETRKKIERYLSHACIILLLLSPEFLGSPDCYTLQNMALERSARGEARVIPILVRPCAWKSTPLKDLQPLPKDGKPISSQKKNEVFFEVSEDIGEVIKLLG